MGVLVLVLWVISAAGAESLALDWTHNTQIAIVSALAVAGAWAWVLIKASERP